MRDTRDGQMSADGNKNAIHEARSKSIDIRFALQFRIYWHKVSNDAITDGQVRCVRWIMDESWWMSDCEIGIRQMM